MVSLGRQARVALSASRARPDSYGADLRNSQKVDILSITRTDHVDVPRIDPAGSRMKHLHQGRQRAPSIAVRAVAGSSAAPMASSVAFSSNLAEWWGSSVLSITRS